ncbi:hypothetical protein HY041_02755 [Candidatus Roizmanbacteria bacterium]|nr:hypothetical protein [Candidatus Roizmanbacteria bacterium]
MLKQRVRDLRNNLLEQLDYELGESSRLFIMDRPYLREKMGWKEEVNVELKQKENSSRIKSIIKGLLKIL